MMGRPQAVLLVEGRDDKEVVYQFCNHHGIDNRACFDVESTDGYAEMLADLRVRPRSGVRIVGVLIDADFDLGSRWAALRNRLVELGYSVPEAPHEGGTIVDAPSGSTLARIAIWVMPNNALPGMMEDFMRMLVPDGDECLKRAESVVDGLQPAERRFKEAHRAKALIHTWLAWQEEPGTPMALAITRKYLDTSAEIGKKFEEWLRTAFSV